MVPNLAGTERTWIVSLLRGQIAGPSNREPLRSQVVQVGEVSISRKSRGEPPRCLMGVP